MIWLVLVLLLVVIAVAILISAAVNTGIKTPPTIHSPDKPDPFPQDPIADELDPTSENSDDYLSGAP